MDRTERISNKDLEWPYSHFVKPGSISKERFIAKLLSKPLSRGLAGGLGSLSLSLIKSFKGGEHGKTTAAQLRVKNRIRGGKKLFRQLPSTKIKQSRHVLRKYIKYIAELVLPSK